MKRVLILDAHANQAIVAIRSLGRRGLAVTTGSSVGQNAGKWSKYVDRYFTYPSVEDEPVAFLDAIEREVKTHGYDMLLPINQNTVELVVKHRDRFEPYTSIPFLPYEKLEHGLSKRLTIEAARKFDVPHPTTMLPEEVDFDAVGDTIGYPVVIKPIRGSGRGGISICESQAELERKYEETVAEFGPVLLQEFVPNGGERGVYTIYNDDGVLSGLVVQQRLRSNPPEGGSSTLRETIEDEPLVALTDRFLTALDWRGVAMAEYRIDARDGTPKLMEINPRLWGSLPLSYFAGVDFCYMLYQLAVGDPIEPDLEYAVGVRAHSLVNDWLQVLARPDKLRAMGEFVSVSSKPCCYDVLSLDDPLPTLGQVLYYLDVVGTRLSPMRVPRKLARYIST